MSCLGDWPDGRLAFPLAEPVPLPPEGPVELAMDVDGAALKFRWRTVEDWRPVGPVLDASLISDEAGRGEHGSFTGAFVGMVAFDISGAARPADFDRFSYEAR
jgi:xylan 1,4-beta-xylosidase